MLKYITYALQLFCVVYIIYAITMMYQPKGTVYNILDSANKDSQVEVSIEEVTEDQHLTVKKREPYIEIESLQIKAPIAEGTTQEVLRNYVGHFEGTAKIGGIGNCALAGHRSEVFNCIFNGVEDIELGDAINLYNKEGTRFTYYCIDKRVIEPEDIEVLQDTQDDRCTIITCIDGGKKRLCIVGILMDKDNAFDYAEKRKKLKSNDLEKNIAYLYSCIDVRKFFRGD